DASDGGGGAPATTASGTVPDTLTPGVRADLVSAVSRANAAWINAGATLDASVLDGAVAGTELDSDRAEIQQLRGAGHRRTSQELLFSVPAVNLDAPGHAVVNTHETWSEEIDDAASGRVLQAAQSATYNETYVVEFQSGGWIVTENGLS